jgi:hypothetical protein
MSAGRLGEATGIATKKLLLRRIAPVLLALLGIAAPGPAGEGGQVILYEGSVWRGHITWMPAVRRGADGKVTPAREWNALGHTSPLPPDGWVTPEFDDSSWFLWREPREIKTRVDGSTHLYEMGQYGIQRSIYMGLRCFRGAFTVEDPAKVQDMTLSVAFRGGAVVYMNGQEFGRAFVPKGGKLSPDVAADDYPEDVDKKVDYKGLAKNPDEVKLLNGRIRTLEAKVPTAALRKGLNVLALELHRAPLKKESWNACGLVNIELRGNGAVAPAITRAKGLQVWNANALTTVSPFGGTAEVRTWAGGGALAQRFPLTWAPPHAPLGAIRLAGARNGVCGGQVVVSSDGPIRNLEAKVGNLAQTGGAGNIPAAAVQVRYQGYPSAFPLNLYKDPNTSLVDVLYDKPPTEVPVRAELHRADAPQGDNLGVFGQTCTDGGAVTPIWIKVHVPADAPAGEYTGTLTVTAAGAKATVVPVKLGVADWTLPQPGEFVTHMGVLHSPNTLAVYYKVPSWANDHFKLLEKTFAYAGELGGKVVFIPLVVNATWLQNDRSLVAWVKDGSGYKYDFNLFDRYMDLVQKHLKPEVVCLYVTDGSSGMSSIKGVSTPDGSVIPLPAYEPKPESVAFWKPVLAEVKDRLAKRGLGEAAMLGLLWEQNGGDKGTAAVNLFKEAAPGMKLVQLAHYGGQKGENNGVPYGYTMSVWGNKTPHKSKVFGCRDLPIKVAWHPRADAVWDIRFFGPRGAFRTIAERSVSDAIGLGPVGLDFWNLPGSGAREGAGAWNLGMCTQTTGALLAPGPDGPLSTVRFEQLREGLQECEARQFIEKALADPAGKAKLGEALAKRCRDVIDERAKFVDFASRGEWGLEGEGWQWFSASGWEERTLRLFACAGEVTRTLGEK